MLGFVISPAKKMNVVEGPPYVRSMPQFMERTRELLDALQALSYEEAKELWRCSDRLARANYDRLREANLERNLTAAVLAYEGIQYQHLAAGVLDEGGLAWLEAHLRMLSGFYGVLRPSDGVIPYRLEMQAKLALPAGNGHGATTNLYQYWGDELARTLAAEFDLVVNVASVEYAKAATPQLAAWDIPVLNCLFCSVRPRDGKLVQPSTEAKAARGSFVRWCAERQVSEAGELRMFAERGYRLDESRSDERTLVFVRSTTDTPARRA